MITLYYDDTSLEIRESDSSYRYRALMEKPQLVLKFSLSKYIEFPVGTWCRYQNEKYSVWSPQNIKKNGERNIEYTITMGNDEQLMAITKLRNSVDNRLKFSMCAKPHEFIEEIVKSLNKKEGSNEWTVGTCIDSTEKTVEFNHSYIDAALQSVADTFETEWEINNKKISLHKVEYFKEEPLPLSYGKGNGFIPGVGRTTPSGEMPIKRLYVQGGDKNIDRSEYGSAELLLPKGQTLEYEGRTYKSDNEGLYIERIDKISDAVKEDSLDYSEIYPSRVGTVSSVECIDAGKNFYDFLDNSIPTDLNFNDYVIEGETATIIFQSGMLAGKEFEFKYKHAERRFELVPQEIDGQTMPNDSYKPAVNDTYAVFGIMLPQAYICNNTDKTGASWDMFREAARHLYENEDQKFTFTGTLQGLWAKRNWLSVGGKLMVGGYILFSDTQFAKEGQKIRITGIKDFLYAPYSPTIELSNSVSGSSVSSKLREIDNQDVVIDDTKKSILQFTKRRFRDAQETLGMLEKSLLNFSSSVNPITVQTMAMLVGDESLQFRFVESKENLTVDADWQVTYDNTTKQLHCPHGYLQHMTLGISSISSSHGASEYKVWEMGEYLSPVLAEGEKKYYLYAMVRREDTTAKGSFSLSENAIDMDTEDGYYYLLVGVLNSELDEERSYVDLYGYTEVLPGRITTDRIVSVDGNTYFDVLNGVISGKIKFKSGSSGLYELDEWDDVNKSINDAQNAAKDAQTAITNAKDAIAKDLGYANFADLENKAAASETIITGGKINTTLIDTELIVTAALLAKLIKVTELVAENLTVTGNSKIAGFSVSGNGLTNTPFDNDAYIIFRNDAHNCFAGLGGNILPASSGLRAVARFENGDTSDWWGLQRNIAALFYAKNGSYNHAFLGSGNGNLDGWIGGYKYSKYSLTAANTIYSGYSNLKDNNRWIIYSGVDGSGITLPQLSEVRNALSIGTSTSFCVEFTILADLDSKNFEVYGRNGKKNSNDTYSWNTDEYPNLVHWNNDHWDSLTMGAGDSLTVLLIYDSSKSGTKGDYPIKYTARVINQQA